MAQWQGWCWDPHGNLHTTACDPHSVLGTTLGTTLVLLHGTCATSMGWSCAQAPWSLSGKRTAQESHQ